MIKKVCVFCASSQQVDEVYFDAARKLGNILVKNNISLVYGGGAVGLMGALSDTMIQNGGKVTGVIPEFMVQMEWANHAVNELIVTKDMHDRKRKMIEDVDAVIALPGGIGTLEELTEVITLKQLGQFVKPVLILNINEYYTPLISFLENMIEERFMRDEHRHIWGVGDDPFKAIDLIEKSPEWDRTIIKIAQV